MHSSNCNSWFRPFLASMVFELVSEAVATWKCRGRQSQYDHLRWNEMPRMPWDCDVKVKEVEDIDGMGKAFEIISSEFRESVCGNSGMCMPYDRTMKSYDIDSATWLRWTARQHTVHYTVGTQTKRTKRQQNVIATIIHSANCDCVDSRETMKTFSISFRNM